MLHFLFLLISLTVANGIDPWETVGGFEKNENIVKYDSCPIPATKQDENLFGDTFYKKLLNLIISHGRFQEKDDENVVGNIQFQIPSSEFKIVKEFLTKLEPLTPPEFRRIDGIMYENIFKSSWPQQLAENWTEVFVKWWEVHYIHTFLFITLLACLYMVYYTNWSRISVSVGIFVIFCVITVVWEILLALKEAELEDYYAFIKNNKRCSNSFWKFWEPDCQPVIKLTSYYWHFLHPLKIFGNICSKLIGNIITPLLSSLNAFTIIISDELPWGFNHIVYVLLNIFIIAIVMYFAFAIIFNGILKRSFTIDSLFSRLHINGNKTNDNHEHHPSTQPVGDTISGENLTKLLDAVNSNNASKKTNINIIKTYNGTYEKEPNPEQLNIKKQTANSSKSSDDEWSHINRRIKLNLKNCEDSQPFDKSHRRVSSVPDRLWKLGGGDHL